MNKADSPDVCTHHFNKIYDDTFDEIRRFIAVKCSDPQNISDILQETYMDYYRLILKKGTDYAQNSKAVLYKIAGRKLFGYYSLKQKLTLLVPLFKTNDESEEYCVADDCGNNITEDDVLSAIESERIWNIISTYPADVRKIMYLYFYEDLSHSQIAKAMGYSVSNVKNKLYRTLSEIREKEKI